MKIFFYNKGPEKLGTQRIYIQNLAKWLKPLAKKVKIQKKLSEDFQVYIMSKYSSPVEIKKAKEYNNAIVGLIHPSDSNDYEFSKLKLADFLIVGSIEEKTYYQNYKKEVLRFPQIENYALKKKIHKNKKKIIFGYHGNLENLKNSNLNYIKALEKLSEKIDLEFWTIYDKSLGTWQGNKKLKIKHINWSPKNLKNFLKKIDIGVVPCTNNFFLDRDQNKTGFFLKNFKRFSDKLGRNNDYIIKFKNNANPGRSHLFHQAYIPVVADFWPSHFEILSDEKSGFLAHSFYSWYYALEALSLSSILRNKMSNNAIKKYRTLYDKRRWVKILYNQIKNIYYNFNDSR